MFLLFISGLNVRFVPKINFDLVTEKSFKIT